MQFPTSTTSITYKLSIFRNRNKAGALRYRLIFLLVLKIFMESLSKVLIASTCIYVVNEGRFDAIQTIVGFYACVLTMTVFNGIFSRRKLCSFESVIGKFLSMLQIRLTKNI